MNDTERSAWLLETIQETQMRKQNLMITRDTFNLLLIDVHNNRYIQRPATSKSGSIKRNYQLTPDDQQDLKNQGKPLADLLWNLAFEVSDGKLIDGCRRDDVVQLTCWPNLTRLARTPNSMKIAALLSARPTSIVLASRLLHVDESEIYSFYSAARAAGLTRCINRESAPAPLASIERPANARQSLIGKLMSRFQRKPATSTAKVA